MEFLSPLWVLPKLRVIPSGLCCRRQVERAVSSAGPVSTPYPQWWAGRLMQKEGFISTGICLSVLGAIQRGCCREVAQNGNVTPLTLKFLAHLKGGQK